MDKTTPRTRARDCTTSEETNLEVETSSDEVRTNEPKKTKRTHPGTGVQEAMHLDFCRGSPCFTIICGGTRFVTYVDAGAKKNACVREVGVIVIV
jgi:siderophore synthetase component